MDAEDFKQNEDTQESPEADPWAAAFAALDKEETETATPATDGNDGGGTSAEGDDGNADPAAPEAGDGLAPAVDAGGSSDFGGADDPTDAGTYEDLFSFTEEEVNEYKEALNQSIQDQTLTDVAKAYIDKGARHTNGRLGATINDPDICKRDRDGVPRFYNPDTGREFTGDNPRRQAQDWVNDYNKELADSFNRTCHDYSKRLLEEQGSGLKVIEFAPTYAKLDPVRKAMFESIIEDYEIKDEDGDLVGYSCDLNKALSAVNRQVKTMQTRFKSQAAKPAPSGPALDMKNSASSSSEGRSRQFNSIAEAMEYQQDQLLIKMKGNK